MSRALPQIGLLVSAVALIACHAPAPEAAPPATPAAPAIIAIEQPAAAVQPAGVARAEPAIVASDKLAGRAVLTEWRGVYYPSTIMKQVDEEHVKVHYTGWGSEWDEVVTLDRVIVGKHLDGSALAAVKQAKPYALDRANPGDEISVEWGGKWWDAQVEHVLDDQRVVIHYDGYGHEWDEVVGASRVRSR